MIEDFHLCYLSSGRDLLRYEHLQEQSDAAIVMADPDYDLSGELYAASVGKALGGFDQTSVFWATSRGVSYCITMEFNPLQYGRVESQSVVRLPQEQGSLHVQFYLGGV